MKLPQQVAGVCIAMALAACSGAQNEATPSAVPAIGVPQNVNKEQPGVAARRSTTALILVANEGAGEAGTIREYAETANGNVAPSTVISNHNGGPFAIAVSSSQGIGIANGNLDSSGLPGAETFALNATGNASPLTTISCFSKPSQTNSVAFDSAGNLYVAVLSGRSKVVDVFAPGATGCVSPTRTISDTGGLAIDSDNVLYVANPTASTIDLFARGSSTIEAQIRGSNTGLVSPATVALDAARNVYVFDTQTETISEFAAGAHGNVAPIRRIAGSNTGLTGALGIAVSGKKGKIFASNPASNTILGFAANAAGNSAPVQKIAGSATGLSNPLGLTLEE